MDHRDPITGETWSTDPEARAEARHVRRELHTWMADVAADTTLVEVSRERDEQGPMHVPFDCELHAWRDSGRPAGVVISLEPGWEKAFCPLCQHEANVRAQGQRTAQERQSLLAPPPLIRNDFIDGSDLPGTFGTPERIAMTKEWQERETARGRHLNGTPGGRLIEANALAIIDEKRAEEMAKDNARTSRMVNRDGANQKRLIHRHPCTFPW